MQKGLDRLLEEIYKFLESFGNDRGLLIRLQFYLVFF